MTRYLLTTPSGSRLYGMHHQNSDYDTYRVAAKTEHLRTRQVLEGDQDSVTIPLNMFLHHIDIGVPQAMEALFSPYKEMDEQYRYMFESLRPNYPAAQNRLNRASTQLFFAGLEDNLVKKRRHGIRILVHLNDLMNYGRFSPVLTETQKAFVLDKADTLDRDKYRTLREDACLGYMSI